MIRAAAYIRVSTEEQVLHGYSIDAQREALERYESEHDDVQIVGWYIDEGISARKKASTRKELQHLLADLEPKQIDLIIFIKLDRWFRNISEYHKVQEVLDDKGVHWKAILENYDTSTASGRLHINIMLSVAQDEADRTSERIKFVFESKVANGEVLNNSHPYGYLIDDNKHLAIDPVIGPIAQDLFDYYATYNNLYKLIAYGRDRYGLDWSPTTYRRMLKNRKYIGEYRGSIDYCPPLIKRDMFDRIQETLKNNVKSTPSGSVYLFTGLLRCATCGQKMLSSTQVGGSGIVYHYYRCYSHHQKAKACPHSKQLNEDKLEAYLLDHLRQVMNDYLARQYEAEQKRDKRPVADKAKVKAKLKRLKDLYVDGLIEKDEYKTDYDMYMLQLEEIEKECAAIAQPTNTDYIKTLLESDFRAVYEALSTPEDKRAFWRSLISEVRLDNDNNVVSITFT